MTEAAGITVSNFIAGALALGLALLIIPGIVKSAIGGSTDAVNQRDVQSVYSKINGLCGKSPGTKVSGEMSLGGQYKIIIDGDDFTAKKNGEIMDEWDHKEFNPSNCNYEGGRKVLEGTRPYEVKINDDGDSNANEFEFVG